jgi:L-2-hydroxyglutarate oxidase
MYDYCIVGGGIVGLATALSIIKSNPASSVVVLEKESQLAQHQTGHNSGVIHSGIYYQPKSAKAELCKLGETATKRFCDEHNVNYRTPGKLIVATNAQEMARLAGLETNAAANGITCERLSAEDLQADEPEITGLGALLIKQTGIVDYRDVTRAMSSAVKAAGNDIICGVAVDHIEEREDNVRVLARDRVWEARHLIACVGLQSDRLARKSGLDVDFKIVPFRGEYYALRPEKAQIVNRLIYPVPDPSMPFLGIHLTPMVDGGVSVGPNAVLGLSREGYPKFSLNSRDMASYLRFPGFWKMVLKHRKSAFAELKASLFKTTYLQQCRKYCPSITLDDLQPYRAGIRAQAISRSGDLIHDFMFLQSKRMLHVCNAPSPAATSAIPIGDMIYQRMQNAG